MWIRNKQTDKLWSTGTSRNWVVELGLENGERRDSHGQQVINTLWASFSLHWPCSQVEETMDSHSFLFLRLRWSLLLLPVFQTQPLQMDFSFQRCKWWKGWYSRRSFSSPSSQDSLFSGICAWRKKKKEAAGKAEEEGQGTETAVPPNEDSNNVDISMEETVEPASVDKETVQLNP